MAIPIIVHFMMRRRRKPIVWAAMRFLLEAYRKHQRRLRLEQLLLLATRCLIVALLAFALGRPLLRATGLVGSMGAATVYILIDNSLTGSVVDDSNVSALDRHKELAADVISQLDGASGDRVGLIALGGPSEPTVMPPSSDLGAVSQIIRDLEPTDSAADWDGAIARLDAQLDDDLESGRSYAVVLSDFLTGSTDLQRPLPGLSDGLNLAVLVSSPASQGSDNVSVVGIEPLRSVLISGASTGLARVDLHRAGPGVGRASVNQVRLSLIDETGAIQTSGQASVRWSPGQTQGTVSVPVSVTAESSGVQTFVAQIDGDAISGDNIQRRPVEIRQALRVGVVAKRRFGSGPGLDRFRAADWVRLALRPGDASASMGSLGEDIELVAIEPASLDAARLAGLDAVIITEPDGITDDSWRRVRLFADQGGLVIMTPSTTTTVQLWADAMLAAMDLDWTIDREASVSKDGHRISPERDVGIASDDLLALIGAEIGDLARGISVWKFVGVDAAGETGTTLLSLDSGQPLALAASPGQGEEQDTAASGRGLVVYLTIAFDLEWTDLPARPLMLPLIQELVRQGVGRAHGSWSQSAGAPVKVPQRTTELVSIGDDGVEPIKVNDFGLAAEPIRHGGLFKAIDDRGGSRAVVAVNADHRAGLTDANSAASVESWLAPLSGDVQWIDRSTKTSAEASVASVFEMDETGAGISLQLLIAAFALAVLEMTLAKWYSHALVAPPSARRAAA